MRSIVLVLLLALAATPAYAGATIAPSFGCAPMLRLVVPTRSVTTVGYTCSGTFAGASNATLVSDYASFSFNLGGAPGFAATSNGNQYACTPSAAMEADWSATIAARGYFVVSMDLDGNCTTVELLNDSRYGNN